MRILVACVIQLRDAVTPTLIRSVTTARLEAPLRFALETFLRAATRGRAPQRLTSVMIECAGLFAAANRSPIQTR